MAHIQIRIDKREPAYAVHPPGNANPDGIGSEGDGHRLGQQRHPQRGITAPQNFMRVDIPDAQWCQGQLVVGEVDAGYRQDHEADENPEHRLLAVARFGEHGIHALTQEIDIGQALEFCLNRIARLLKTFDMFRMRIEIGGDGLGIRSRRQQDVGGEVHPRHPVHDLRELGVDGIIQLGIPGKILIDTADSQELALLFAKRLLLQAEHLPDGRTIPEEAVCHALGY